MMKKVLLPILFLVSLVTTVHAAEYDYPREEHENFKFGLRGGLFMPHISAFVEYKLNKALGIRGAILGGLNLTTLTKTKESRSSTQNGRIHTKKIDTYPMLFSYGAIPITVRWYPGEGRQACVFMGLQASSPDISDGLQGYVVGGLDYESSGGFQLGLDLYWRMTKLMTKLLKGENITTNKGFRISLGYNFAKLF